MQIRITVESATGAHEELIPLHPECLAAAHAVSQVEVASSMTEGGAECATARLILDYLTPLMAGLDVLAGTVLCRTDDDASITEFTAFIAEQILKDKTIH